MATTKKLKDTEWIKVKVNYRDQDNELGGVKVATNNIIINGKRVLKHYTVKIDTEVELPVTVVDLLKAKYDVRKDKKTDKIIKVPTLMVELV